MKILYHHRIASRDGQYVHVEEIINALRRDGHEVEIVGPDLAEEGEFGEQKGMVAWLKRHVPAPVYELMEFAYSLLGLVRLLKAINRFRPDFIYERFNLLYIPGALAARLSGIPLLLEVNSPLYEERSKFSGLSLKRLARWTQHYTWRNADVVLPVTGVLSRSVVDAGVPESKIEVIHNGINQEVFAAVPDRSAAKARLGLDGRIVVGFTGFMREWHGIDRLLDLVAGEGNDQVHLLLVGDGPARSSLEDSARTLGVEDRLTITGIVGRQEIADYVAAFDIAMQPDVVDYASPLKMFEYLACGCAIVAPDRENIREILNDNHNALLFPPGDYAAMSVMTGRLCEDADLRNRLGNMAAETITARNFTWQGNARRIIALAGEQIGKGERA